MEFSIQFLIDFLDFLIELLQLVFIDEDSIYEDAYDIIGIEFPFEVGVKEFGVTVLIVDDCGCVIKQDVEFKDEGFGVVIDMFDIDDFKRWFFDIDNFEGVDDGLELIEGGVDIFYYDHGGRFLLKNA